MGRVGFRGRTRRYAFPLVGARSGAGVDGATPRRRPACAISGGFPWQFRHRVPDLSAYATKMRVPLLRAMKPRAPFHLLTANLATLNRLPPGATLGSATIVNPC